MKVKKMLIALSLCMAAVMSPIFLAGCNQKVDVELNAYYYQQSSETMYEGVVFTSATTYYYIITARTPEQVKANLLDVLSSSTETFSQTCVKLANDPATYISNWTYGTQQNVMVYKVINTNTIKAMAPSISLTSVATLTKA